MADVTIRALVPLAHVASTTASIAFYQRLGFEVRKLVTPPEATEPSWASLVPRGAGDSAAAELMIAKANAPVIAGEQAVLFYIYCADVEAMHAQLAEGGLEVGPITKPFYNPGGEFRLTDPDGYVVYITHL